MNWARHERHELADLLSAVGPDAPSLCEGWTTRDLAAHLVIRDRRPDAAAGLLIKPLAGHTERVTQALAEHPWEELVEDVRTGPPGWAPPSWEPLDRAINTVEFFVHHEDVRRAQSGWKARQLDVDLELDLWKRLRLSARMLARRSPVGLVLRTPEGAEARAKRGEPAATITGPASELMLFVYGRQAHALVDIDAPEELAEKARTARLGL